MGAGILITGTDTGVGKTYIGCALAAALRRKHLRVAPFKPAETGCAVDAVGELCPADALLLREACGSAEPVEAICPYRFATPVAPAVAARLEPLRPAVDPDRLVDCYNALAARSDTVIVETAGGILVPLADGFHFGDLARRLQIPAVVVAGSKLGVLNHTLLTLEWLRAHGIPVLACVLNHPYAGLDVAGDGAGNDEHGPAVATNAEALRRLLREPLLIVPRATPGTAIPALDALADAVSDARALR